MIQRFFKEQKQLDLFRVDLLRKAWDIQRDILSRAWIKTGGKVLKNKLKRLSVLTESTREEFIMLYFQKTKLSFIVKFLELHDSRDPRIEKYQGMLKKLDKKLGLSSGDTGRDEKGKKGLQ